MALLEEVSETIITPLKCSRCQRFKAAAMETADCPEHGSHVEL